MGGARPPPFTIFTMTYKVAVYAPAARADTLTLFHLYPYVLCAGDLNPVPALQQPEPVFLNVYGAQESIPRNELRQPT
jgi:hypothetical protein